MQTTKLESWHELSALYFVVFNSQQCVRLMTFVLIFAFELGDSFGLRVLLWIHYTSIQKNMNILAHTYIA